MAAPCFSVVVLFDKLHLYSQSLLRASFIYTRQTLSKHCTKYGVVIYILRKKLIEAVGN